MRVDFAGKAGGTAGERGATACVTLSSLHVCMGVKRSKQIVGENCAVQTNLELLRMLQAEARERFGLIR